MKQIPKKEWENCPCCPNRGWYEVMGTGIGYGGSDENGDPIPIPIEEPQQEQCEFCYTNEKSVFNQAHLLKKLKDD